MALAFRRSPLRPLRTWEIFRSFENLRRSLNDPEIITFDELYARAESLTSSY